MNQGEASWLRQHRDVQIGKAKSKGKKVTVDLAADEAAIADWLRNHQPERPAVDAVEPYAFGRRPAGAGRKPGKGAEEECRHWPGREVGTGL